MRYIWILYLFCSFSALYADDEPPASSQEVEVPAPPEDEGPPPIETIRRERLSAEKEFEIARSMFNPWYTGPLLTPSAHLVPPGHFYIQPYLFFTTNYGHYTASGGNIKHTKHLFQIAPQIAPFQFGVTDWIDFAIAIPTIYQRKSGEDYFNIGDISFTAGFGILKEAPFTPAVKFCVRETFPTGKYQKFEPKKAAVESTGGGAYVTTFSFVVSKVNWWIIVHPMTTRVAIQYSVPMYVNVRGINSYGGDPTTKGVAYGGNTFQGDVGYELSLTQRWVFAIDAVYTWSSPKHFCGRTISPVGGPFNDQFSIAPAIEYNRSSSLGIIGGVWFTLWGRNSSAFHSEIISLAYFY